VAPIQPSTQPSIQVRPFARGDREQVTTLVNAHIGAVVPNVSVSVQGLLSQLEREPGEFIVDRWVTERLTLVAEQHGRYAQVGAWFAEHHSKLGPSNQLPGPETATSVRFGPDGPPVVTDGPFLEGKESIGGYTEIDVADPRRGAPDGEDLAGAGGRWRSVR
jgi:hypothetical protein